jgi:GT2 family glycosyltransferase
MKISVIICTKDRVASLEHCLRSVAQSIESAGCRDAEIVVVDNNSVDSTSMMVSEMSGSLRVPLRLVHEARTGLAVARNRGVGASCGSLLVFTDDDCQMNFTYIQELLDYDEKDVGLVMRSGSVVLGDPGDLPLSVMSTLSRQRWKRPMPLAEEGKLLSALIGCNMTMRRAVFDQLGPFDESLGAGTTCRASEDTDYFYRAYLANITLEFVPDMIVRHFHGRKSIAEKTKLLRNYAIGNGALVIKYLFTYPNFSRHLVWEMKGSLAELFGRSPPQADRLAPFDRVGYMTAGCVAYVLSRARRSVFG